MKWHDTQPIYHGFVPRLEMLNNATSRVKDLNDGINTPFSFAVTANRSRFDYLFPELQVPEALLPERPGTKDALVRLGMSMRESEDNRAPDSSIPSIYTYLGQFIDHDITLEAKSDEIVKLDGPDVRVLTPEEIRTRITNTRTPALDLDSMYYKPAPRARSRMILGTVSPAGNGNRPRGLQRPADKDSGNDLPRRPRNRDPKIDRAALIGDARNDENLIVAQLHVAFLRAHNAIAATGRTFDEARKLLRRHYQWVVIKDFLPRICDPWIVNSILRSGNKYFRPARDDLFIPLEFSVAAYRFGHSMVRNRYDVNVNFRRGTAASLIDLFTLTKFSGTLKDIDTLPDNWVIEWENFVDRGTNRARPIDTRLSPELFDLQSFGKPVAESRLSVRNLLRGYMLRVPTGQAVAAALSLPAMSANDIQAVARGVSDDQFETVRANGFSERTPLWYYILAEAAASQSGRLGPVGSMLVAEVLIGLIRGSKDSILRERNWQPTFGRLPGRFDLRDLLALAGVLNRP